jgi:hypothetical protein
MTKQVATKYDEGKPKFSTVPKLALYEIMRVFTTGAAKYGRFNYSLPMDVSRYTDACIRHLIAFETYKDRDDLDEIGTHHLANAAASIMMALDGVLTDKAIDDRNKGYLDRR